MMTAVTLARVALLATPFGFGPASKAYSIGCLLSDEYDIDVHYFGSDCALDFFAAHGLCARGLAGPVPERDLNFVAGCDAVVNVLAPELIPSPEIAALTHYVDSLGFIWQHSDLPPQSLLHQVRGYYAQDLFRQRRELGPARDTQRHPRLGDRVRDLRAVQPPRPRQAARGGQPRRLRQPGGHRLRAGIPAPSGAPAGRSAEGPL